jgi:hypothetical protein
MMNLSKKQKRNKKTPKPEVYVQEGNVHKYELLADVPNIYSGHG